MSGSTNQIAPDVVLAEDVSIVGFVNLYGCTIGAGTKIGPFVEIQRGASVGARCKVSSHSFVCEGVTIEDEVFIGHGVMFTNDVYPFATTKDGQLSAEGDWILVPTVVRRGASIGSNATILPGVIIGEGSVLKGWGHQAVKLRLLFVEVAAVCERPREVLTTFEGEP